MKAELEKDIFLAAIELDESERQAFLKSRCSDAAMIDRVNALLASHEQAAEFMSSPTVSTAPSQSADEDRTSAIGLGESIGPYLLDAHLGEGGFGRVYLARQQEPVVREVALKVLKADVDSESIVARFEAERQALAVMDHPNVARVFDGGETTSGKPYFVMEYVRGKPITKYCDRKSLSLRERLALFEQVCLAVQHAHHKGIIHRDLKPSNVLVTEVDGQPVPKVIDFGIAKAIGAQTRGSAMVTMEGHLVGTPAYMSPEQAIGTTVMDTRSDVYTLGVLLYEVLTGLLPFDPSRLEKTPLNAVVKIICDETPAKPSTRVAQSPDMPTRRGRAAQLRGDLDWIVMRAMEKDPARRYQTASGLGDDIRRFLRDEAVEAGPPSGMYRVRKFALRHRGELLAAGLIVVALVAGLVTSLVFAARAEEQTRLTAAELEKSEAFADFAGGMLSGLDPAIARGEDTTILRQMLADAAERLETEPPASKAAAAEMHELLGTASYLIADFGGAEAHFADALAHAEEVGAIDDELGLRLRHRLGQVLIESSQFDDGRRELERVYDARMLSLGKDDPETIHAHFDIGVLHRLTGDHERARTVFKDVLARRVVVLGKDHVDTMSARNSLATTLDSLGEHELAATHFREVIPHQIDRLGPEHPHTLATRNNYADTLENLGQLDESAALLEELLETKRRVLEPDHPSLIVALNNLATVQRELGDTDRAEILLGEAVDIAMRTLGPRDRRTLILTNNHAGLMHRTGRSDEAIERLVPAIVTCEEVLGPEHPLTLAMISYRASAEIAVGRPGDAVRSAELLVTRDDNSLAADDPKRAIHRRLWGEALLAAGSLAQAEEILLEANAMHEQGMVRDPEDVSKTAALLAAVCEAAGKHNDAESWRRIADRDR